MTVFEIVSVVLGVLGIVGGIIGFLSGRKALEAADLAQKDATKALARSAVATEEAAAALHRANELTEAQIPRKLPRWELRQLSKSKHLLLNIGDATARNVRAWGVGTSPGFVRVEEKEARDVPPGDSIVVVAVRPSGPPPRLRWEWDEDGSDERLDHELNIQSV